MTGNSFVPLVRSSWLHSCTSPVHSMVLVLVKQSKTIEASKVSVPQRKWRWLIEQPLDCVEHVEIDERWAVCLELILTDVRRLFALLISAPCCLPPRHPRSLNTMQAAAAPAASFSQTPVTVEGQQVAPAGQTQELAEDVAMGNDELLAIPSETVYVNNLNENVRIAGPGLLLSDYLDWGDSQGLSCPQCSSRHSGICSATSGQCWMWSPTKACA